MKKLSIYLGIIIVLFGGLYAVNVFSEKAANSKYEEKAMELYKTTPDKLKTETKEQLDDENYQNIIIPSDFNQKLENGDDMLVYFFSPTCYYCQQTTPTIMDLAEEADVSILQYNVWEDPSAFDKYITSTPTLIHFADGKEVARYENGLLGDNSEADQKTIEDYKAFLQQVKEAG
ncbi:thioredoxin family protein [Marinicrinis lubricantis]|uniref:Thioredoxin family protein n=1 Tax=Marinicrinis lubricantis TaxID=2086470 RepID=A0ABW1ITN9_9BACL